MSDKARDIDFALVEEVRPPIYTAMKYWGKKLHNIWRKYIETYTPKAGLYLDPFAGSAISIFEAVKAGRRAIGFDLNPLTSFVIEVLSNEFNPEPFRAEVHKIIAAFKTDDIYGQFFTTTSRNTGETAVLQSTKWADSALYEVAIESTDNEIQEQKRLKKEKKISKIIQRYLATPSDADNLKAKTMSSIGIPFWHPTQPFPSSPSFSANFISCIGGNSFSNLWTKRNLYVISKIFDHILRCDDETIKKQLLFGFIQTIHLCTKMSVPRREAANRAFSTSWGRSAYLCANRQMEMNPLLVFESSCLGKRSVESCLSKRKTYVE